MGYRKTTDTIFPTAINKFEFRGVDFIVLTVDGQPWFIAKDVCSTLGMTNMTESTVALGSDERKSINLAIGMKGVQTNEDDTLRTSEFMPYRGRGNPNIIVISESALYKLIMRSSKPVAREFQNWITKDVIPAIRKDGAYVAGEEVVQDITDEELISRAMDAMKRKIDRLTAEKRITIGCEVKTKTGSATVIGMDGTTLWVRDNDKRYTIDRTAVGVNEVAMAA